MFHSIFFRQLRVLFVVVLLSLAAVAQETNDTNSQLRVTSYGFVSPNTEENLSLDQAIKKMRSPEQASLISATHQVGCRARFKPLVLSALGSWSDGAENSTILKTTTDHATIRYAVSALGKRAQQKAVLYFREGRNGDARLYIFYPSRRDLVGLSKLLDRAGIAFRTLLPLKARTLVYVVDLKNELREKIPRTARLLKAKVRILRGYANFIGDDEDREKAQSIFAAEIDKYESTHSKAPKHCAPVNP